jgi:hypothetical protein
MNNDKLKKEIALLTKKPEMWIGVGIVLILIIFSTTFIISKSRKAITQKTNNQKVISPISTTPTAGASASLKKEGDSQPKTVVKKLADTAGEINYQVAEGDSYWKITEKTCGRGTNFETVQAANQDQDLQPGNIVKVICE